MAPPRLDRLGILRRVRSQPQLCHSQEHVSNYGYGPSYAAQTYGYAGLPQLMEMTRPVIQTVHIYEHVHEHNHIICRKPNFSAVEAITDSTSQSTSSKAPPPQALGAASSLEPLEPVLEETIMPKVSSQEPSPRGRSPAWSRSGSSEKSSRVSSRGGRSDAFVEWPPEDDEEILRTTNRASIATSVSLGDTQASLDLHSVQEAAPPSSQSQALGKVGNTGKGSSRGSRVRSKKLRQSGTMAQWSRYAALAETAAAKAKAARPPGWGGFAISDDHFIDERLKALEDADNWSVRRAQVRRQLRDLPESSPSDAKRRIIGIQKEQVSSSSTLERLNEKEKLENRDRVRNIQAGMQDCSRSRHQLVRIQNQLKSCVRSTASVQLPY
eukprot:TRINITY_DN20829_c0_g1_i1.p1 TRINITY_DN20829_c0_g1~~TRINITY_DN20829_c0_g1_i1.p1  ORF type:complete len:382 (+),score=59.95 TRINITY_DN20829_c0_g1_i1:64-1209(+)